MEEVNIYVRTTAHGPARKKKVYCMYIIQLKTPDKEYTKKKIIAQENMTENQAALTTLIKAFERFNRNCKIRINTKCEHVLHTVQNHWPQQWEKNGWKKANGKEVQNAELWQQLLNVTRQHTCTWTDEPNEFDNYMETELRRFEHE